jgi:hypothetical protein
MRKIIVFEIIRDMMNPNCTSIVWTLFNRTLVWLVGFMGSVLWSQRHEVLICGSLSEWVFSLKPKWAFVHLYHGKNKVHLDEMNLISTIGTNTNCIGSCKSNYHRITATTAPCKNMNKKVTLKLVLRGYLYNMALCEFDSHSGRGV